MVSEAPVLVDGGKTFRDYGLGTKSNEITLAEATIRGVKSLEILEAALKSNDWLARDRPRSLMSPVLPYVALAPMRAISLEP